MSNFQETVTFELPYPHDSDFDITFIEETIVSILVDVNEMPTFKQLTCYLDWTDSGAPLAEYQTKYGDGQVETYIAVPEEPAPFSIRLTSKGYIAQGIAMFVYIDGEYHCNRNRHNLRIPDGKSSPRHTEIDFRVRQKEVMLADGSIRGKPWRFERCNIYSSKTHELVNRAPSLREYIGTIEVIVLRCDAPCNSHFSNVGQVSRALKRGNDHAITTPSLSTMLGLDGQWDEPEIRGRPEKQWGFEMTGTDTGVFRPMEQPRESHSKDSEILSGHPGELTREISNESRNRGRDGVAADPVALVINTSQQPARPLYQAQSASRSVTRSETCQKMGSEDDQNKEMEEDGSPNSNHVVGAWTESPPQTKRTVPCIPRDVQNLRTETLPESHYASETVWKTKVTRGKLMWTRCGVERSPTEGYDIGKEKELDIFDKDWYADNSTSKASGGLPRVKQIPKHLGSAAQAWDTEDVIATEPHGRWRQPYSKPFPGAWPRSATPSPPQWELPVSRPGFEEITNDRQAQTVTILYGPSAHAPKSTKMQTYASEYPLPSDSSNAWPHITAPESVRDAENTLPSPPSHPPSPSPPRSPSYRISRSNTLASNAELTKAIASPPRIKVEKSSSCQPTFDPTDTESNLYTIPEEAARQKSLTHQVCSGRSRAYVHKMARPQYIDSHEDPYAVFIFQYRSKSFLKNTLNIEPKNLDGLGTKIKSIKAEIKTQSSQSNNLETIEPKDSRIGDGCKEFQGQCDDLGKVKYQSIGSHIDRSDGTHDSAITVSKPPKMQNQITSWEKVTQSDSSGGWSGDWAERISNNRDQITGEKLAETGDTGPVWVDNDDQEKNHQPYGSAASFVAAKTTRAGIDRDEDSTHGYLVHGFSLGKSLDQDWSNKIAKDETRTELSGEDQDNATADFMW